jgi:hypothetical protein
MLDGLLLNQFAKNKMLVPSTLHSTKIRYLFK